MGGASGLGAGAPIGGGLAGPGAPEEGWLGGLHISGYASQTFGMWQNPTTLRDFTPSRNNLAVSRSLLQVDENYRLNENNTFFMREWFVYEPPYSFNSANNTAYATASTPAIVPGVGNLGGAGPASFGHFLNDWYNVYQVRDAWWENKTGPLTTFIGNQIVVWGQSIAFRVGDVINPVDTSWAFGFSNLEQSRNAQWMIHPILNLPGFGPFSSNFIEAVIQPGFSPQWWENDYADGRYKDHSLTMGRAITGAPAAMHGPSARFDIHYDNQLYGAQTAGTNAQLVTGGFVSAPVAHELWSCTNLHFLLRSRIPLGTPQRNCALSLSQHNVPYGTTGDTALADIGEWRIPGMQPENWNEGLRLHTLIGDTEWTALYYNDNVNGGGPAQLKWTPFTNIWHFNYPDIQEAGITADRPLPMPESISQYFPAVGRAEALYVNHESFQDMAPQALSAQRWSDVVKWMAAVDIDQAYAPWLTQTGNLSANLEVFDTIIMDKSNQTTLGTALGAPIEKNQISSLLNVGTSWWWGDFQPTWTMIYAPKGNTFLLFPSVVLNPPWTKKYFVKLQAIEVLGSDRESVEGGLFKGQSLLTAQLQYNFNLL